jgi:hypothetical protein
MSFSSQEFRFAIKPLFDSCDGIAFTDGVSLYGDVVYATPNLSLVAAMHFKSRYETQCTIPLVGITSQSNNSLKMLESSRIVFFDAVVDEALLLTARRIPNKAYIAHGQSAVNLSEFRELMSIYSADSYLGTLDSDAVPFWEYLAKWSVTNGQAIVVPLLKEMSLSAVELSKLLALIEDPVLASNLKNTLAESGVSGTHVLSDRYTVSADADGIWLKYGNGATKLVSPASVQIDSFVQESSTNEIVCSGSIKVRGEIYQFSAERSVITTRWLEQQCATHGHLIAVSDEISKDFFATLLGLQGKAPVKLTQAVPTGWHEKSESLIFQDSTITSDGTWVTTYLPLLANHTPSAKMRRPHRAYDTFVKTWIGDSETHKAYWQAYCAVLHAMLYRPMQINPVSLCLYGSKEIGNDLLQRLESDMLLQSVNLANVSDGLEVVRRDSNIPSVINLHNREDIYRLLHNSKVTSCIVSAGDEPITPAKKGWIFVDVRAATKLNFMSGTSSVLPSLLTYFMQDWRHKFNVKSENKRSKLRTFAHLLHSWFSKEYPGHAENSKFLEYGIPRIPCPRSAKDQPEQ